MHIGDLHVRRERGALQRWRLRSPRDGSSELRDMRSVMRLCGLVRVGSVLVPDQRGHVSEWHVRRSRE